MKQSKEVTQELSFKVVWLSKNKFRLELVDSKGQVYAEWTSPISPGGSLTVGPFRFSMTFMA